MFKNLDTPPEGGSDSLLWVDFAELRAMVHPDKCFSKGDLSGVAQRAKDIGRPFEPAGTWDVVSNINVEVIHNGANLTNNSITF